MKLGTPPTALVSSSAMARCVWLAALLLAGQVVNAQALAQNLVYTAINPCRLVDTRAAGGILAANAERGFDIVGVQAAGALAAQGGDPSGCPIPGFTGGAGTGVVKAIALNVVAVGASGAGDLKAWPTDQSQPNASILNYAASHLLAGLNIANAVVVPVRQDSQGNDITVLAQVSSTHVVIDVVGYFTLPAAGTLSCQSESSVLVGSVGQTSVTFNSPACPTGSFVTGGGFVAPPGTSLQSEGLGTLNRWQCSFVISGGPGLSMTCSAVCCTPASP
jgi:hypothetical protein